MCSLTELRNSDRSVGIRQHDPDREGIEGDPQPGQLGGRIERQRGLIADGRGWPAAREDPARRQSSDEGAHRQSDDQEQDRHGVGQAEPGSGTPSGTGTRSASSASMRARYRAAPTCSGIQPVMR